MALSSTGVENVDIHAMYACTHTKSHHPIITLSCCIEHDRTSASSNLNTRLKLSRTSMSRRTTVNLGRVITQVLGLNVGWELRTNLRHFQTARTHWRRVRMAQHSPKTHLSIAPIRLAGVNRPRAPVSSSPSPSE